MRGRPELADAYVHSRAGLCRDRAAPTSGRVYLQVPASEGRSGKREGVEQSRGPVRSGLHLECLFAFHLWCGRQNLAAYRKWAESLQNQHTPYGE